MTQSEVEATFVKRIFAGKRLVVLLPLFLVVGWLGADVAGIDGDVDLTVMRAGAFNF